MGVGGGGGGGGIGYARPIGQPWPSLYTDYYHTMC